MLILNIDEGKPARGARERRSGGGGGGNDRKGEKTEILPSPHTHACLSSMTHARDQGAVLVPAGMAIKPANQGSTGIPRSNCKAFSLDLLSNKARHKIYRGHLGTSHYLRIYGNDN